MDCFTNMFFRYKEKNATMLYTPNVIILAKFLNKFLNINLKILASLPLSLTTLIF